MLTCAMYVGIGRSSKAQLDAKDRAILLRYSLYLLYWYKSTNTDAAGCQGSRHPPHVG